jgi:WD40 repeat protein/tetratricopeptide (TPR) repeat protein
VLRPAFDSPDRVALSEQIKLVEPPRPRSIDPRIPRDLETIVLKAIEKDPKARYASAEAMAEDLRRFLDDQPILARRVGAAEQYLRWARRNPVIAGLGGVLMAVMVLATVASALAAGRMAALLRQNEVERREADRQRDRAEANLYAARIGLAENALHRNDPATAAKLLDLCRPETDGPDRRGWEWSYLDGWCRPELRTLLMPGDPTIGALAVSPDGRFLVAAGGDPGYFGPAYEGEPPTVHVYDLPGLTLRRTLAGHWGNVVTSVAFRPDGKRLATAAPDGRFRLWDVETWRELRTLEGGITEVLGWSPDGRRLALHIPEGVWIGDPETMRTTARIAETVESLTWSPDGKRIAVITGTRGVHVWDAADGRRLGPPLEGGGVVRRLFWSPPGRRLTGFCTDGTRKIWDAATGKRLEDKAVVPELADVASSQDGSFVVIGSRDGLLRVVDTASGNVMATLFHGSQSIRALALSPDGSRLFVGGLGLPGVKVFDPRRDPCERIAPAQWQLCAMAFDEGGEILRTINWGDNSDGANLEILDIASGKPRPGPRLPVSNRHVYPRGDFAFAPDGRQLAAPKNGDDSAVGVWDVDTRSEIAALRAQGTVAALAFGAQGRRLAIGAWVGRRNHGEVAIWDLAIGRVIRTIGAGTRPIRAVAFSADGRRVAAGGGDGLSKDSGWACAWDAETGASLVTLDRAGPILALAFDPDGSRFAAAEFTEQILHLWDLATGTEVRQPAPAAVSCLAFTPDGRRLASVGYDGQVHLADARTGGELLVLRSAAEPYDRFGFTPRLTFSRDGSRLAANGLKDLSFWEIRAPTGPESPPEPADVAGWLRQGRARADQGDVAGTEAAYARARELDDGDPSPWIEHALLLWRHGDLPRARDALARAVSSLPDDPGHWADLGRLLGRFGWMRESETALAKARSLAERRLSLAPDDEAASAALADLLPEVDESRGWTSLEPATLTSAAGTTLNRLPDGSVLASGLNPAAETYALESVAPVDGITALRLEALLDPSLPHRGPGREPGNGNFVLHEIRLSMVAGSGTRTPVRLARARASYSFQSFGLQGVAGALDADPTTAWSIWPQLGQPHWAIFQASQPFGTGPGLKLRVELVSGHPTHAHHALGRFRLAVTNRSVPFFEPSLTRIKADPVQNGLTRLGAAYYLKGDWASAAAVLERAAARPHASALDDFLLALARHHLGRTAEARSVCDRALKRLRTDEASDETRDVAFEALTMIRDLGVDDAESLLLDAVFPADPFSR